MPQVEATLRFHVWPWKRDVFSLGEFLPWSPVFPRKVHKRAACLENHFKKEPGTCKSPLDKTHPGQGIPTRCLGAQQKKNPPQNSSFPRHTSILQCFIERESHRSDSCLRRESWLANEPCDPICRERVRLPGTRGWSRRREQLIPVALGEEDSCSPGLLFAGIGLCGGWVSISGFGQWFGVFSSCFLNF